MADPIKVKPPAPAPTPIPDRATIGLRDTFNNSVKDRWENRPDQKLEKDEARQVEALFAPLLPVPQKVDQPDVEGDTNDLPMQVNAAKSQLTASSLDQTALMSRETNTHLQRAALSLAEAAATSAPDTTAVVATAVANASDDPSRLAKAQEQLQSAAQQGAPASAQDAAQTPMLAQATPERQQRADIAGAPGGQLLRDGAVDASVQTNSGTATATAASIRTERIAVNANGMPGAADVELDSDKVTSDRASSLADAPVVALSTGSTVGMNSSTLAANVTGESPSKNGQQTPQMPAQYAPVATKANQPTEFAFLSWGENKFVSIEKTGSGFKLRPSDMGVQEALEKHADKLNDDGLYVQFEPVDSSTDERRKSRQHQGDEGANDS